MKKKVVKKQGAKEKAFQKAYNKPIPGLKSKNPMKKKGC